MPTNATVASMLGYFFLDIDCYFPLLSVPNF
uniref:Uncharacterized protein n=1 Tax=Anguilla anguilla TaxID=7936 RepID=A0A0E9TG51_ANGAN